MGNVCALDCQGGKGEVLENFPSASRLEVGRKVVSTRYDAFRLQVSSSYREVFNRALSRVLEREHWEIVREVTENLGACRGRVLTTAPCRTGNSR